MMHGVSGASDDGIFMLLKMNSVFGVS